jgi:hypothetical protein
MTSVIAVCTLLTAVIATNYVFMLSSRSQFLRKQSPNFSVRLTEGCLSGVSFDVPSSALFYRFQERKFIRQ